MAVVGHVLGCSAGAAVGVALGDAQPPAKVANANTATASGLRLMEVSPVRPAV